MANEIVYVGGKEIKFYIPAAFFALSKSETIKIVARGKNVKRALDLLAILKREYLENPKDTIVVGSEKFEDKWVTTLEIELTGKRKDNRV